MALQNLDMSVLSKGAGAYAQTTNLPYPKSRWKTRVLLPVTILAAFAATLGYTLRDTFLPAVRVKTVPVITKMAAGGDSASSAASSLAASVAAGRMSISTR